MWILSKAYVNWLYSQEPEAEFSADVFLVGEPSAQWKSTLTPPRCSSQGRTKECSTLSRFGMTFEPLTAARGKELLTSCLEGFRAKTSPPPGKAQESTESAPDSGESSRESFAKFDLATRSWRTAQCCFLGVSDEFSETWPKSGMMLRGSCSELTTSELRTCESEFGFSRRTRARWLTPMATDGLRTRFGMKSLAKRFMHMNGGSLAGQIAFETVFPTPTVSGNYNRKGASKKSGDGLATYVAKFPTPRTKGLCGGLGSYEALQTLTESGTISDDERRSMAAGNGGSLNPTWVEWLMGWPVGWTALSASETDKCPSAQRPHSESCTK